MRVLDLFAGLKGWSEPFAERGHEVVTVDNQERFNCTYTADVLEWEPEGEFDIVLASPPCEAFSVMTMGKRWLPGYIPAGRYTETAIRLVERTRELIEQIRPAFWIVENPRGMLRKLYLLPYERRTVTYCQYGAVFQKPTDLWGGFPPSLELRPMCRPFSPCHEAAPRGNLTGVQGVRKTSLKDSAAERAKIPHDLALDVCLAAERDFAADRHAADYTGTLFEEVMSKQT